jgi:hypothetical protein
VNVRFKSFHKRAAAIQYTTLASRWQYHPVQLVWGSAYPATAPASLPKYKNVIHYSFFMIFFLILFIYGLLNDDVSSSDYIVLIGKSVLSSAQIVT